MKTYRATSNTIACSLTSRELEDVAGSWQKLLRRSLLSRDEVPGGLHFVFHPGSVEALEKLIDIERVCCPWITFQLDGPTVTMTAAGAGEAALREMRDAPSTEAQS